jgi:TatA/E family protein of Tat protein translocase
MLSPVYLVLAALVILLVFGPKTLSKIGRAAGRTVRSANDFKKTLTEAPLEIVREVISTKRSGDDKR